MAIRTQDELREALSGILGDTPSDDGLTLMEDLSDTLSSLTGSGSAAEWQQKYNENDAAWRKRYKDRFGSPVDGGPKDNNDDNDDNKPMTFEDLFKEVK